MGLHCESQKNWFNIELTVYSHRRYKRVSLRDGFSRCLPWSRVSGPVEERDGVPDQDLLWSWRNERKRPHINPREGQSL